MARDDRSDTAARPPERPDLNDDETLLRELAQALASEHAVSERAREAARAAYSWRTIDEELMQLAHDSALSDEMLVRGAAEARVIGFSGRDLTLEVELDAGRLTGQVIPARVCRVTVQTEGGVAASVDTDESGVFQLDFDSSGSVRFTLDVDGEVHATVWVTL